MLGVEHARDSARRAVVPRRAVRFGRADDGRRTRPQTGSRRHRCLQAAPRLLLWGGRTIGGARGRRRVVVEGFQQTMGLGGDGAALELRLGGRSPLVTVSSRVRIANRLIVSQRGSRLLVSCRQPAISARTRSWAQAPRTAGGQGRCPVPGGDRLGVRRDHADAVGSPLAVHDDVGGVRADRLEGGLDRPGSHVLAAGGLDEVLGLGAGVDAPVRSARDHRPGTDGTSGRGQRRPTGRTIWSFPGEGAGGPLRGGPHARMPTLRQ